MYIATTSDIRLLNQRGKRWLLKLEILNKRFQVLAEVQGECISISLSADASSDVRRTCSLVMHIKDSSYYIDNSGYFWMDKMVRCYYGLYDATTKEYVYYPQGIFVLNDNSYSYNSDSKNLSLSMVDLMATLNNVRGSAIGAETTVVEVNSDIRNAMISTLVQLGGCGKYKICTFPSGQTEVPYDLEFDKGCYVYDIITKLRDLYPCYETYFDIDGTFVCAPIPSCIDDPVAVDASIMDGLIIEESSSTSFSNVKNVSEIWGKELDAERTAATCTTSSGTYTLAIEGITTMDDGITYSFTADTDCTAGMQAQINDLTACPIVVRKNKADGTTLEENVEAGSIKSGLPYVLYYTGGKFVLYGELNIHALAMAVNATPDATQQAAYETQFNCRNIRYVVNPYDRFAVERIGIINQVFSGEEYDDIYTTELALERAAYENWKSTRLQDTVTLNIVAIPWLSVNTIIEYTSFTGEKMKVIVDSVSLQTDGGTMTVKATRFYPYYPW